jgi:aerobic carbon-monoxide dehydrogenase small subunit
MDKGALLDTRHHQEFNISMKLNGKEFAASVEPRLLLVDLIRDVAKLKGTHIGCDSTTCGACTVFVNGKTVKSCTMFAVQADGAEVLTIEGLAINEKLNSMQLAFWENHALQCGYCTPGMIMSSLFLLSRNSKPTRAEIKEAIAGNLCRCTGYVQIIEAIEKASKGQTTKPDKLRTLTR